MRNANFSKIRYNTLYKFSDNKYLWLTTASKLHESEYIKKNSTIMEVYEIDDDGCMNKLVTGYFISNPYEDYVGKYIEIADVNNFGIKSYKIECPLEEVNLRELYKLRKAVDKSISLSHKTK